MDELHNEDKEQAHQIKLLLDQLNKELANAAKRGLECELDVQEDWPLGGARRTLVTARIARPL